MKVIRPVLVTGSTVAGSSVAEADHPEWSADATYALGDRVIKAATHRIYESVIADNIGHDPSAVLDTAWLDAGPTNRWAMFDPAGGPSTAAAGQVAVELVPAAPVSSLGLVDVSAAEARVRVEAAGVAIYDVTHVAGTNLTYLDLPAVAGQHIFVTLTAPGGATVSVGKLVIGNAVDLGETEEKPTVSITDFSRRETDDFGVTTVVRRGWSRRVTTRARIDSAAVDRVQRYLADIRAVPALWIGDEGFEALSLYGFYKDFAIDLELGTATLCSLSIEGLPSADVASSTADPAVQGESDLLVIPPVAVTDAVLTASNVQEDEYPQWATGSTYQAGDRVVWSSTHRVYESLIPGNIGKEPPTEAAWLDIGPTNRWAMFDQALGTATERVASITVTLAPGAAVTALAVLDSNAASVRVQSGAYDQVRNISAADRGGSISFLDLDVPVGGSITVTIAAEGAGEVVSVGTLLLGAAIPLGVTENTPSIGIDDYSRKEADDFGNTAPVERAWAKRMSVRSLVRTEAVDSLVRNMAALRATPALWIGNAEFDSLTIYGFYRDFSAELVEATSLCAFTIEGLSKAPKIVDADDSVILVTVYQNAATKPDAPAFGNGQVPAGWTAAPQDLPQGQYRWATQAEFRGSEQRTTWTMPVAVAGVSWGDVIDSDPAHPKPEDGATVGATPEQVDQLAQLDTDIAQANVNIAAAQDTIAQVQLDAAVTRASLEDAQDSIAAQGLSIQAAQTDIIAAGGRITSVENTLGDQGASINSLSLTVNNHTGRLASVESTVTAQGASINQNALAISTTQGDLASLSSTVTAHGASISQNAQAISTTQGNLASLSSTVTSQGSSISQLQSASSTQAGQLASLSLRVNASGSASLLKNGGFENGLNDWISDGQWSVENNYGWGPYAYRFNIANLVILEQAVRVEAGVTLTLAADMSLNGDGFGYVDMIFRDSAGNVLLDSDQTFKTGGDFDPSGANRQIYKCTATAPAGTWEVVCRFVAARNSGTFSAGVRQIKLERGSIATGYSAEATLSQTFTALSTLNTQYASLSSTVSTQGSSIIQNQQAITNLQGMTATLTTQVTAGGANICPSGGFENGLVDWSGSNWNFVTNGWGNQVYTSANGTSVLNSKRFPVFASTYYTIAADWAMFATGGSCYVDLQFFDGAGNVVLDGPQSFCYPTSDFHLDGSGRQRIKVTAQSPGNAVTASARFVAEGVTGNTFTGVRQIKVEQGMVATAYSAEASVTQSFQALSTLNTQYASLSSTVSTQGVTISSQQTAITTINGNVTTLFGRAALMVDVNGVWTGYEINNNGTTGEIKLRADRLSVVTASGGTKTFEIRQGTIIGYYPSGNKMYQLGDQSVV